MSWEQDIQKPYKITLGEGSTFTVLWRAAAKAYEYNVSQFEFIGVKGSLVDRREVKGRTFPLEIFLDGPTHLQAARRFETASFDKRPWTIEHPLYGNLIVHPLSLNFDNTESVNYTKITGTLAETITNRGIQTQRDPIDTIEDIHVRTVEAAAMSFAITATPVPADMSLNNQTAYNLGEPKVSLQSEFEDYFNAFNSAETAILDATSEPLAAVRTLQSVLEAPARFVIDVDTRIDLIKDQCETLMVSMVALLTGGIPTIAQKALFENNMTTLVSSMSLAAGLPLSNNYKKSSQVLDVIEKIIAVYNEYIEILGDLQSGSGGNPGDYNPDSNAQTLLNQIVNFTISNLFNIALNAKQERTFTLDEDSNSIILSHRFYGPSADDEKLLQFIDENNIGLSEILGLKKGRVIKYYI
jgi:hypothetical protein